MDDSALRDFVAEDDGQTLVEYGLLISLIALVVVVSLSVLGGRVKKVFENGKNYIATST